jgi:Tfp pilus assembly PilM family ATPase
MTLGLDIGRRSVKLVRADTSRRTSEAPRALRGAMRDLDPSLEGAAARSALVNAIRECAKELGAGKETVAIAVPRAEAVLKTVYLPPVSAEERARLIRFQAAKDVPFELSEVVLASGVVGEAPMPKGAEQHGSAPLEVNYAAVRTSLLDSLRDIVREAGLLPGPLEISTQAAARAARLLAPDAPDSVLVLVGALASEIVVLRKGRIAFSRSASVGVGAGGPSEAGWLDKLVPEVQRSLRAASGPAGAAGALAPGWADTGEEPKVLLLAGGGVASNSSIATTLAARLGIPARTLEPLGPGSSPSFIVARGLADPRPVDGIPVLDLAGIADAAAARQVKQKGAIFGGLGLAVLITIVVLIHSAITKTERNAEDLEHELKVLKPEVDATRKLLHEVTIAEDWEKRKGRSLDVLLASAQAIPGGEGRNADAFFTRFGWSEGKAVLIGGKVRDQESVDKFVRRLNHEAIIEHAQLDYLRYPNEAKSDPTKGAEFGVTLKLRELPGEKLK